METNLENPESQEMSMAQLLAEHEAASENKPEQGAIHMAKVVSVTEEGILVDIGEKKEALIPKKELANSPTFAPGETIPVLVGKGGRRGDHVSWKAAVERMAWEHISQSRQRGLPVSAKAVAETKGGLRLICEDHLSAFMPASHVDIRPVHDMKPFIGQTFSTYIVESDKSKDKLVLSRKLWLSEENQKKKAETLAELKEGETRKGVVTGITSFGAFVDLGGIEGLLHIGELEWARTRKVSDVLKPGQAIEVKILKFDPTTEKISLSRRELMPHPWNEIESRFPAGSLVQGRVTSLTDFGAFVEIAPQVEGLLHASEISWKENNPKPKDFIKKGQTLRVKVIGVSREKEKLSLSLKRTQESPWDGVQKQYPVGSRAKVTVTNLVPFGAFARLPLGIEGLIHISDFSWVKRVANPSDILKIGDEIEVKILEINSEKEKVAFGLKQTKPNPFEIYKKGSKVTGPVTQVTDQGAMVQIEPDLEGYVPVSEASLEKVDSAKKVLNVGDSVEAKVTHVDAKERKIQLSIRQLEQEQQRQAVKKYSVRVPRPSLGQILDS